MPWHKRGKGATGEAQACTQASEDPLSHQTGGSCEACQSPGIRLMSSTAQDNSMSGICSLGKEHTWGGKDVPKQTKVED